MKTNRFLSVLLAVLMLATTLLSGVILPAAEETAPAEPAAEATSDGAGAEQ